MPGVVYSSTQGCDMGFIMLMLLVKTLLSRSVLSSKRTLDNISLDKLSFYLNKSYFSANKTFSKKITIFVVEFL